MPGLPPCRGEPAMHLVAALDSELMRLFVAVDLDASVRHAAGAVAQALQQRLGETLRARWVPADNMHLTVRFIGHVHEDRVSAVIDALRPELPVERFAIALGDPGVFPPHGPPRVLWIGLAEGLPSLRATHEELNRRLRPLGFEPESRPYSAHLTLARVKEASRGSAAATREALRAVRVGAARCHIDHVTLFESRLSPRGSIYAEALRIPFR